MIELEPISILEIRGHEGRSEGDDKQQAPQFMEASIESNLSDFSELPSP